MYERATPNVIILAFEISNFSFLINDVVNKNPSLMVIKIANIKRNTKIFFIKNISLSFMKNITKNLLKSMFQEAFISIFLISFYFGFLPIKKM